MACWQCVVISDKQINKGSVVYEWVRCGLVYQLIHLRARSFHTFTIQTLFKVTVLRDLHQSDHMVVLLRSTVQSAERDIISSGYYWQGAWYVCVCLCVFLCVTVCLWSTCVSVNVYVCHSVFMQATDINTSRGTHSCPVPCFSGVKTWSGPWDSSCQVTSFYVPVSEPGSWGEPTPGCRLSAFFGDCAAVEEM